jgi:periplasmic protein TonB
MTQSFSLRATSLAASSLTMGAAVLAALMITFTVEMAKTAEGPIFESFVVKPPVSDTPPETPEAPRDPVIGDAPYVVPITPLAPLKPFEFPVSYGPPAPGPVSVTRPDWVRRPADLERYFPRRARERGIEGAVQLDCVVTVAGALDCVVLAESPVGWEFGYAALRMSRDYAMVPAQRDGQPVEGRYRMRVPFQLD